jgi:hypothetical protein
MKAFRSPGVVPCDSGKITTRCCAETIGAVCRDQGLGQMAVLKILLRPQGRELEADHLGAHHPMAGGGTGYTGIG